MKNKITLIIIILLGFTFRIWNLDNLPAGFTADEASHGYDAYSLIQTGKDQWGQPWPIAFRSFGDFKLPVYTYLTIPFILIGGLNEFTVRLPGALFGTLAILTTFLFAKELFKLSKLPVTNYRLPMLSALLLMISPWHVQLSRQAVEANLTSFFIPLALWAWLKGLLSTRNLNYWWLLSAFILGINLYTYHAARAFTLLIVPLIILISCIQMNKGFLQLIKQHFLPILIFIIFLVPMGISLVSGGSSRGLDVAIFNPTDNWQALSNLRHETVLSGIPDFLARLTTNKLTYTVKEFIQNYIIYLSPYFLFVQGSGEATYGMLPGRGVLNWFELPFILIAILFTIKKPNFPVKFLLVLLLLAPIPAALSKGAGLAANRATPMLPFIHILSAYGLTIILYQLHKLNKLIKITSYLFLGFSVLLFFGFFLKDNLIHAPKIQAQAMSSGWREAVPYLNQVSDQYDYIIISRKFNEPQIFLMFYTPMDPVKIQQITPNWLAYEKQNLNFIDQLGEYHLGKITFLEIQTEHFQQPNTLIVARPQDLLTPKPTINQILKPAYPQPTPAITFIDTNTL